MSSTTATRSTVTRAAIADSATVTPATIARAAGAPRVVPADTTVSRAAAAVIASERLSEALTGAKGASDAVIVARYGADVDSVAVRLAKRAADELSGATKSRGGMRADVLAVLDTLANVDALTDSAFVASARARLDANAADKRARRERKQGLADILNDSSATMESRAGALSALVGMDDADLAAKRAKVAERLNSALVAARAAGIGEADVHVAVTRAYSAKVAE
jgi:hypothetical protein